MAMATDIRMLLIKLADRLNHLRTLNSMTSDVQLSTARETLDIYAPLANRLGIDWLKREFEDLAFYYIDPFAYQQIVTGVAKKSVEQEEYIEEVKKIISEKLEKQNIKGRIFGRVKHIYSIYRKMVVQNLDLPHVYDIIAFRIILKSVSNCYEALSVIHSLWEPIAGRYKDYINRPKPNMYQSLHTTVVGPFGEQMEIQIRTVKMDRIANEGIAAHWAYKEGKAIDAKENEKISWLRQTLEIHQEIKNPIEFLRAARVELFPEEVYVFTPEGEVRAFPKGATPIDFAYSIHSQVGHHCTGAKINGKMTPLKYQLQTGDAVEIITSSKQHPSQDWLNIACTQRAKNRIRHWFKNVDRERSISIGREILEKEFRKRSLNFSHLINSELLQNTAVAFSLKSVKDLLASVGYGKITAGQVAGKLSQLQEPVIKREEPESISTSKETTKSTSGAIRVKGVSDILVRLARCCTPLPGESIKGYITKGHGITVHRSGCPNLRHGQGDRIIEVEWDQDSENEQVYPVAIELVCSNSKGLLASISSTLSNLDINIQHAKIRPRRDSTSICQFVLEVSDYAQFNRALAALRSIKDVFKVWRSGFPSRTC